MEHFDVIIVGAGLSGVGAAHHLSRRCPDRTYAILEGRGAIGGTWDLFRYPGIRSDSDMFTLGYGFRPWLEPKVIADGPSIRSYVEATAREAGLDRKIRFHHWVTNLSWDSASARWTLTAKTPEGERRFTCNYLWMCSGYYRYSAGYEPEFPGREKFRGKIVHPQKWPEDLDYAGKTVVVIGSGATAVTLVPAMTDRAAHVTMLQRSPSWYFSLPQTSGAARALARLLPAPFAARIVRWWRIFFQQVMYKVIRARPKKSGERLFELARAQLPEGYDAETHFRPRYDPWDQRLCVVPDGDLFKAIGSGKASVETGEITTFAEDGIRLKSGKTLKADIIVTATGLELEALGGAAVAVDGRAVNLADTIAYRGLSCSGVPNIAFVFGYTNASYTLRADLISAYVCRLLNFMDARGYDIAVPVNDDPSMATEPFLDLASGYITRAIGRMPKQGARAPWRNPQSYFRDILDLRWGRIDDGVMRFSKAAGSASAATAPAAAVAAE
ncbi:MAG TPA: FAD-containing monooxygenase EthA [Parvularcula sp.]|nr:FAD-containing monooxygenase EthA [Parvularcula sp.]